MPTRGRPKLTVRWSHQEQAEALWAASVLDTTVSDLVRDALSDAVSRARALQPSGPPSSSGPATCSEPGTNDSSPD